MKKNIGYILAFIVGVLCGQGAISIWEKAHADTTISPGLGWILDSSTTTSVVTVTDRRTNVGGTIANKGAATVYINWSGAAVTADTDEGVNKCYLEAGDSCRVPRGCTTWSHETASGTAKLLYIEE